MNVIDGLTSRDLELVVLLARGHTTDRVAREFQLSRHTVGERISALLSRLNCKNRAELVAYCYAHGLLPTGVWPPDGQPGSSGDELCLNGGPPHPLAAPPMPVGGRGDNRSSSWAGLRDHLGD